jgi:hypothetical protein
MTKLTRILLSIPVIALVMPACSESRQPISGRVAQSTFSSPISKVKATRPGTTAIDTAVAADGSFTIDLPQGQSYRLEFVHDGGGSALVFPRPGTTLAWRFDVRGGGPAFDIGSVRHVGDPSGLAVTFAHTKVRDDGDGGMMSFADGALGQEVECEDGRDRMSGAVCVEDTEDQEKGSVCGASEHGKPGHHHAEEPCEDGIDAGDIDGGLACHESHGHHGCDDGADGGLDCQDDDDGVGESAPVSAAVADRNLPPALGSCEHGNEDEQGRKR